MTAEFTANRAREFTVSSEEINAELWYAKYKDQLFKDITNVALNGNNSINVYSNEWNHNETKFDYLKSRLVSLGYTIKIEDYYKTADKLMIVSW